MGLGMALPWMLCWLATAIIPLVLARLAMRQPRLVRWGPSDLLAQAARSSRVTRGGLPWLLMIVRGLLLASAAAAAARPLWRPAADIPGLRSAAVGRPIVVGGGDSRIVMLSSASTVAGADPALAIRRGLESLATADGTLGRTAADGAPPPTILEAAVRDLPLLPAVPRSLLILGDQPPLAATDARLLTAAVQAGAGLLVCLGPQAVGDADDRRRLSAWLDELAGVTVAGRLSLADSTIELSDALANAAARPAATAAGGFATLPGPGVMTAADLVVGSSATLLARAAPEGRPLLVEARYGRGVVCVSALPLSFTLLEEEGRAATWSDLAAWPSFIPFIDRLVVRLLAASAAPPTPSTVTADTPNAPIIPLAPALIAAALVWLLADGWLSSRAPAGASRDRAVTVPLAARAAALAILATMGVAWAGLPTGTRRADGRQRPVALLLDTSPSMAGRGPVGSAASVNRLDALLAALTGPAGPGSPLDQLARDRRLAVFTAAATLVPLGDYPRDVTATAIRSIAPAEPAPAASRVGAAVEAIIRAVDDAPSGDTSRLPAAIVVAGDGAITAGPSWATAARLASAAGVPLVAIPVQGDEDPAADALPPGFRVTALRIPRLCHADESLTIDVEAEATAPGGPLELGVAAAAGGPPLAQAPLACSTTSDGMSAHFSGRIMLPPGSFAAANDLVSPVISVSEPASASTGKAPAAALTCPLVATDAPVRVLLIEAAPRFEYRFLERMLSRDRGFDVKTCMLDPQAAGRLPTVPLPATTAEWDRFDVVVLGDVPAGRDDAGRTAAWRALREAAAVDAVGIAWLPGPRSWRNPDAGLAWLPAVPDGVVIASIPRRLQATTGGRTGDWLPLAAASPDDAGAAGQRAHPGDHPEVFAVLRPASLRPTARIIATAAQIDAAAADSGPAFVAAFVDRVGAATILGQLCETWRWRRHDERAYDAYWRRTLRRLAESHQLGRLLPATLTVRPPAPVAGDALQVEIVPTRADTPLDGWHIVVAARPHLSPAGDADTARRIELPAADLGGVVRVDIEGLPAGRHAVRLVPPSAPATATAANPSLTHEIVVAEPILETAHGLTATAAIAAAARTTGGAAVALDAIAALPEAVATAVARVDREAAAPSWDATGGSRGWLGSPAMANMLMLLLVTVAAAAWWQPRSPRLDGGAS